MREELTQMLGRVTEEYINKFLSTSEKVLKEKNDYIKQKESEIAVSFKVIEELKEDLGRQKIDNQNKLNLLSDDLNKQKDEYKSLSDRLLAQIEDNKKLNTELTKTKNALSLELEVAKDKEYKANRNLENVSAMKEKYDKMLSSLERDSKDLQEKQKELSINKDKISIVEGSLVKQKEEIDRQSLILNNEKMAVQVYKNKIDALVNKYKLEEMLKNG